MTATLALGVAPFLVSLALRGAAPRLADRYAARWVARALVVLALCAALSTGLVLCTIAGLGLCELPGLARAGDWSADSLADVLPVPTVVGVAAGIVALALAAAALGHVVRVSRHLARAARAARALGPGLDGLVVVDDDRAGAYALPGLLGRPGRTVVSRTLLRALDPVERQAVLAHEASHLRHRHVAYVQAAELAAAANPLLRPVVGAVRDAVEFWADDDAAAAVGDPRAVARAVARASLLHERRGGALASPAALAVTGHSDLARRVAYLLRPVGRPTPGSAATAAVLAVVCVLGIGAGGGLALRAHADFERAELATSQSR